DLDSVHPYLDCLTFCRRRHEVTLDRYTSPGGDSFENFLGGVVEVDNGLDILNGRAIVNSDELVVPECPDPTLNGDLLVRRGSCQQLFDPDSFHALVFTAGIPIEGSSQK